MLDLRKPLLIFSREAFKDLLGKDLTPPSPAKGSGDFC